MKETFCCHHKKGYENSGFFFQNSGQILDSPKISVSSDGLPERSDSSSLPPSNEKLPRQLPPIPKFSHPILTSRKKSPKAVTEEPIPGTTRPINF